MHDDDFREEPARKGPNPLMMIIILIATLIIIGSLAISWFIGIVWGFAVMLFGLALWAYCVYHVIRSVYK